QKCASINTDTIDTIFIGNNSKKDEIHTLAIAAAAGVYLIPGIGPVALTVTSAVVIGGVTIAKLVLGSIIRLVIISVRKMLMLQLKKSQRV
ncbi:hypothetical protein MWG61_17355, partial [Bacillus safensis]|uniref:hypothetical protein n=1 Tax=Bacillus safensis TaxID=561879 RepID=UPI002282F823